MRRFRGRLSKRRGRVSNRGFARRARSHRRNRLYAARGGIRF